MIITEKQTDLIWNKIIEDLEGEDVVLEIKVLDTNIEYYNRLLKFLIGSEFNFTYSFGAIKKELPKSIDSEYFESDEIKDVTINLSKNLSITCGFNEEESIEFFTNSVINLRSKEFAFLFVFIEQLGKYLKRNVYLFVEEYPKPSSGYDYSTDSWFVGV